MNKLLLTLAAVSTVAVSALPAAAATAVSINQREAQIGTKIERSLRNHVISRQEAASLRTQLARIERVEQRYRRGGLNRVELRDLNSRLDRLAAQIRVERRDDDGRRGDRHDDRRDNDNHDNDGRDNDGRGPGSRH